jgi:hypothetical protein
MRTILAALLVLALPAGVSAQTLLVGDNNATYANAKGLTNGVARYITAGYVAVASGSAAQGCVRILDWAGSGSNFKIIVFNSGGTQLAISNATASPTVLGFACATFASPPTITSGQTYFLAVVVNTGQVDWYSSATTFQGTDCGGTYSFASPGGATLAGTGANIGASAIYVQATGGGGGGTTPRMLTLGVGDGQ